MGEEPKGSNQRSFSRRRALWVLFWERSQKVRSRIRSARRTSCKGEDLLGQTRPALADKSIDALSMGENRRVLTIGGAGVLVATGATSGDNISIETSVAPMEEDVGGLSTGGNSRVRTRRVPANKDADDAILGANHVVHTKQVSIEQGVRGFILGEEPQGSKQNKIREEN